MTETIDDGLLDEAWLAAPARRSRVRMVLAALLAASVCFLGGALVQKHFGAEASGTGANSGFPNLAGGAPSGFPNGLPGGALPGADQGAGAGTGSGAADATDSVIGTVVEIRDGEWVVEDLGGHRHTITVDQDTSVVREEKLTLDQIENGATVQVTGTTNKNKLQADDITLR
jgi:hypothetical protein